MKFKMNGQAFVTEVEYGTLQVSGNEEYGFRPYQLLVSSVAVCSGGVLRKIMEKQRLNVEDIQIETDVKRNDEGAQEVTAIHMHFMIKGEGLSEKQIEKNLHLTRKNCSMVQSVQGSIDITESYELI
ncbi:OsmC family protein [Salsuginibacillus kocurii]|uniref:OsmC family protein n=1 Tax=Salsuginibacillus kocurii TaxID=427078 RepID=UPI00037E64BD|nr:OsmC family protein [Salsuginibacillus kocurii]